MRRMRLRALIGLGSTILLLAGCGGSDDASSSGEVPTGAAFDRAFIDAMIPHHEGAIAMARAAKAAGLSQPDLVEVADDILATQQDEIDRMKAWRKKWFGSSAVDQNGAAALGMGESEMGMQHDPDTLGNSGDVDAEFAQMMIDHHQGAVDMAKLAAQRAERREIKELANAVISAQEIEIDILRPHTTAQHHDG